MSESLFYLWPWSNSRKSMKYGIVEIWGLKDNIGAFVVIPLLCCLQEITVLLRIEKLQRLTGKKNINILTRSNAYLYTSMNCAFQILFIPFHKSIITYDIELKMKYKIRKGGYHS